VESHGWYRLAPCVWEGQARAPVLRRVEILGGEPRAISITWSRGKLRIAGADDTPELRAKMARMFQLHVDLADFHARHAWAREHRFGRLLCGATLFEDVVKIILTTNTMWRQTVRMCELLVAKCGRGGAFPEPADIRRFTADELQQDCRLGYRAKSIRELADAEVGTCHATTEACFREYQKLPGIGPYGAAHLLAMDGRHDFIAVDSEFRRFVRTRYHGGRKVADKTLLRHYAKWGRWKYLAYWSELWAEDE
jgi:3-methyladenine DNA glycosylase/8-oxoguanine DNA glycosylase